MLAHKIPSLIIMSFVFVLALAAKAETTPSVFSCKTWKEQQILSAQNRLLRLTTELEIMKNSGSGKERSEEKSSAKQKALQRFHRSQEKSDIERLENEAKLAKEAVQIASELTVDDYVTVYLPTLTQTPDAIDSLVESMSREEISHILKEILKNQSDQRDRASRGSSKLSGFLTGQASLGQ